MTTPQGRYRIEERGRRLVTIDTLTGKEVSSLQGSAGVEDAGPKSFPVSLGRDPAPSALKPRVESKSPQRPAKPAGEPRSIPDFELPTMNGLGRSGRKAIVTVFAVCAAGALLVTSLWVLLLFALVFSSDVRKLFFTTLPAFARAFIDRDGLN
jgi:hypothetical protein